MVGCAAAARCGPTIPRWPATSSTRTVAYWTRYSAWPRGTAAAARARPTPPSAKEAQPETIRTAASENLPEVAFDGSLFRPAWKLSTGKPLATFADGSPAIVLNRFGQGRTILLGCSALMLSPYASQAEARADFAKVRQAALLGAELAGAERPCRVSVPRVLAIVRDGPQQTVVVLINMTGTAQTGVDIRLTVPHKVQSAADARGKAVVFAQQDVRAASLPRPQPRRRRYPGFQVVKEHRLADRSVRAS